MIQEIAGIRTPDPSHGTADRAVAAAQAWNPEKGEGLRELKEAAQALESVFLNLLMTSMRKTVTKSEVFSGGRGEEIFSGLFDTTIAERSAKTGSGLGIAKMILERYSKYVRAAEGTEGKAVDVRK